MMKITFKTNSNKWKNWIKKLETSMKEKVSKKIIYFQLKERRKNQNTMILIK